LEETAGSIDRRREEVRRARGLGTPAELFDADADNKIPIERRVTFIGRRFLSLEREIRERLREVTFQTTPPVPELTLTSYGVAILLFVVLGEKLGTWSFLVVLFAVLFIAGRWQMKLETTKQQNEEKKEQLRAKRYEYEYEG
jgi:Flp pilus assembly protein TadB